MRAGSQAKQMAVSGLISDGRQPVTDFFMKPLAAVIDYNIIKL